LRNGPPGTSEPGFGTRRRNVHDLVVRGVTTSDGTGSTAYTADVAVDGDLDAVYEMVKKLCDLPGGARRMLQRATSRVQAQRR
jgi:hypothetical protein